MAQLGGDFLRGIDRSRDLGADLFAEALAEAEEGDVQGILAEPEPGGDAALNGRRPKRKLSDRRMGTNECALEAPFCPIRQSPFVCQHLRDSREADLQTKGMADGEIK